MVDQRVGLVAVQVSSVHHRMPNPGNAWQILVLLLSVVLIGKGAVLMVRAHQWRAQAISAHGHIIDKVTRTSRRRDVTWLAVIEFEADGQPIIIQSPAAGRRWNWAVGGPVEVLYDRTNPHRAGPADSGWEVPWSAIAGLAILAIFIVMITSV